MKICILTSLYEPFGRGGAEQIAQLTAQGFVAAGHQVSIITLGRKTETTQADGAIIHRIRPFNLFSFIDIGNKPALVRLVWHLLDVLNWSSRKAVKKILLEEKPDLVMSHNLKGLGYLLPKLIRSLGIRHLHVLHDVQLSRPSGIILFNHEKPFLILDKMYEKICLRLFGSPSAVISPSKWLMDYYVKRGFFKHSKQVVIKNPVKLRKAVSTMRQTSAHLNFLYVGQLEESKGIIFLLETLKKSTRQNFTLKILGSGRSESILKEVADGDKRFQFYGYVRHAQLNQFFAQADALILPSLCYENSPTVIYESFMNSVPVIASDIGGVGELVNDHTNGLLFEPGNAASFLEVFEFVMQHPQKFSDLKKNTSKPIQNCGLEKYIQSVLSLL